MTTKVVTTTGFAEDAFNEGLVAVNPKAEEIEEASHTKCDPFMTYDVISKDSPIPQELIRLKEGRTGHVWSNRLKAERLNTRDNDTREHEGFQWKRKTVAHCTNHV
jgi:hypothetical protein